MSAPIPTAAIEAAWLASSRMDVSREELTQILAAAAPHMLEVKAVALMLRAAKSAGWYEGWDARATGGLTERDNPYRPTSAD